MRTFRLPPPIEKAYLRLCEAHNWLLTAEETAAASAVREIVGDLLQRHPDLTKLLREPRHDQ